MAETLERKKPRADFPLFPHHNGQWAKKIRGKLHYFGTEPEAALKKYTADRDDLQAGRTPRRHLGDGVTVKELCNRFLHAKQGLLDAKELAPRTWRDYHDTCQLLAAALGRDRLVAEMRVEDFEQLRVALAKGRGPVALGNQVRRVRSIFKYAFDSEMIDKPLRFGPTFRQPSKKFVRRARQRRGKLLIAADELRAVVAAAEQPLRAMILLGINCGFGQTDVASLPKSALDLAGGWVDFPRPKTAVERRCPLWPETVAAVREAIAARPAAKASADAGLVFVTKYGYRWVRHKGREKGGAVQIDAVAYEYRKLLVSLGMKGVGNFYNLRHTFRTIGDRGKDQPAINFIMGHTTGGMDEEYREEIGDVRLKAVTDLVHAWLWPTLS